MGRRRRIVRGSRDKYSVEHKAGNVATEAATGDGGVVIVPATSTEGMRKVKHVVVNLAANDVAGTFDRSLFWAIVYVPQGTTANPLQIDSGTMYEPNQYVMGSGVADFAGGPLRIHCRLSRNLNSGDAIYLIIHKSNPANVSSTYQYAVSYAITLQ